MTDSVFCPQCGAALSVPKEATGKKGRCKKCACIFQVPAKPETREEEDERLRRFVEQEAAGKRAEDKSHRPPTARPAQAASGQLAACKTCGKQISRTAPTCPHCGESLPGLRIACPSCGSGNISAGKKGFGLGKAGAGLLLLGPVGLLGGMIGRKKAEFVCNACGRKWRPTPKELK